MYFVAVLNSIFDEPFSIFDEDSLLVIFGKRSLFESSWIEHKADFLVHELNELFVVGSKVAMQDMDET